MTNPDQESIRLDQLMKISGLASTGGHAKIVIQNGEVLVNGEVELRRRRKLFPGDKIEYAGETVVLDSELSEGGSAEEILPPDER